MSSLITSLALRPWSSIEWERSEEHTFELQSHHDLVCRLLLEKKKTGAIRRNRNTIAKLAINFGGLIPINGNGNARLSNQRATLTRHTAVEVLVHAHLIRHNDR